MQTGPTKQNDANSDSKGNHSLLTTKPVMHTGQKNKSMQTVTAKETILLANKKASCTQESARTEAARTGAAHT